MKVCNKQIKKWTELGKQRSAKDIWKEGGHVLYLFVPLICYFFQFLTSKEIPRTYHLIIIHFLWLQHVSFHSVIKNIYLNVASASLQTSQMFNVKTYSNLIFFVIPSFQAKLSLYSKGNHRKHASMFRV